MNVQREIDRLIAYQAAQWYERLKEADAASQADFIQWISESPRHTEAFLAISSEAPVIRAIAAEGSFDLDSLLKEVTGSSRVVTLTPATQVQPAAPARRKNIPKQRAWWTAAAALAVAIVAIPAWISYAAWQRYETPTGEQRTIQLAEGSIVNLNSQSRVDIKLGDSERQIHLPHGEATFKVAHDASRPFRVRTPGAIVEATGTQFNVYVNSDKTTTVAVLAGSVRISKLRPEHSRHSDDVDLAAGQGATVQFSGNVELQAHPNVAEAIAWQQRKLIFKGSSLVQIAAEFNRYNPSVQIHLEAIDPDTFRFTGTMNADDPYSLATLLQREPDLLVEYRDDQIMVRRANIRRAHD